MNTKKVLSWMAIPTMVLAFSAQAHEPAEHNKSVKGPDCGAMGKMNHASMDMKEPVMQAMMKKCMTDMHGSDDHDAKPSNQREKGATEQEDDASQNNGQQHDDHNH